MIVFGIVVAMRIVSFIAFTLVVGIPGLATDPIVFRTVILIDSGLGFVLDVAIVFVALIAFSTARRVEIESDRLQLFMDNVYRKLP